MHSYIRFVNSRYKEVYVKFLSINILDNSWSFTLDVLLLVQIVFIYIVLLEYKILRTGVPTWVTYLERKNNFQLGIIQNFYVTFQSLQNSITYVL